MKTIKQIWKEVNIYTGQEIEEKVRSPYTGAVVTGPKDLEKEKEHYKKMRAKQRKKELSAALDMGEDAPANAAGGGNIAGLGVDHPDYPGSGEPGVDPKKKKRKVPLIDGRSKLYKQHRERLESMRAKREAKRKNS